MLGHLLEFFSISAGKFQQLSSRQLAFTVSLLFNHTGKYANGINAATYKQGQVIDIEFEITAQHQGWIEFRLGDIGARPITQAKLIYTLPVVGLYGFGTRYYFPPKSGRGKFKTKVKLPDDLSCNNCVLQWWWKVGNSWGCDKSGCGIGRGNQETFVNCADIKIDASSVVSTQQPVSGTQPSPVPNTKRPATQQPVTKTKQLETKSQRSSTATQQPVTRTTGPKAVTQKTSTSFQEPITKTSGPETTSEKPATGTKEPATGDCKAVGIWKKVKGMDKWCKWNCPAFCPRSHCQCGTMPPAKNCRAVGRYKAVRGMTEWCNENCPACPSSHCACE